MPLPEAVQNANLRFALAAAEMAANTRCTNVVLLDLRGKSPVAEFFVIATGSSAVQMRAVAEELRLLGKRMDFAPFRTSGMEQARWILVDFVHVVFHAFDQESRDFYDLELLWGDSPRVDWRALMGLPAVVEETSAQNAARRKAEAPADILDDDLGNDSPLIPSALDAIEPSEIGAVPSRRRAAAVYPTPVEDEAMASPRPKAAAKTKKAKAAAKTKGKPVAKKKVGRAAAKKPAAKKAVKNAAKAAKPAAKKNPAKVVAKRAIVKTKSKPAAKKPAKKKTK